MARRSLGPLPVREKRALDVVTQAVNVRAGVASKLQAAMQHHRAGRVAEAERLYRDVLTDDPRAVEAVFLLGVLAMDAGRTHDAVDAFARATQLAPRNAAYHANLGEALRRAGRVDAAIAAFVAAMSMQPDLVAPVYNLGLLLQDCGERDAAVACFERAAELKPDLPDVRQRVSALRSASPTGPGVSPPHIVAIGIALALHGRREDAVALLARTAAAHATLASAHGALGGVLVELDRLDEAAASLRRALELDPDQADLHVLLGNAQFKTGLLDEAIASYRRAASLRPGDADIPDNVLFALHFHAKDDARALLDEARAWDRRHARPLAAEAAPHGNDRAPDRRLRVGYVSPDFREHCQAFFLHPLLRHHDHGRFEIFCYSNVLSPDKWTGRLLDLADQRLRITAMEDADVAARIREDRIDVLVDVTMHMERNRLGVFARRPAPVQVCWLAYPGTTGLSAMDYRITDPFLDPPGSDTSVYSERSLWLPDCFWCYEPLAVEPSPGPLPARSTGRIQFGCLNNFCKVNDTVIALWARVMRGVEGSRLLLLCPPGEARRRVGDAFERHGVDAARIDFEGYGIRPRYLDRYRSVDVCLDTFPYNGHTTSLDAFWMGVPVVTLVGATVVGRAGLCQATNLGLPELVARTPDEYVSIAVDLCKDLERLAHLRAGLRSRMEKSPLMDAPRFARNLEGLYRTAWQEWCEGPGSKH